MAAAGRTRSGRRNGAAPPPAPLTAASVAEAVDRAAPRARVLVCGSLYLAGSVLGEIFGAAA